MKLNSQVANLLEVSKSVSNHFMKLIEPLYRLYSNFRSWSNEKSYLNLNTTLTKPKNTKNIYGDKMVKVGIQKVSPTSVYIEL